MQSLLTILTGSLLALSVEAHNAIFKSVHSVDRECVLYLRDGTCGKGDCTVRCRGLVARFWNDTVGRPAATINRFYRPDPEDCGYYERTEQCLGEISAVIPAEDACRRANCSVSCYEDQYGRVDRYGVRFVPFTELQHKRVVRECEAILGLTTSVGIEHCREFKCLFRCFLIREDLYSDAGGPDIERMSVQCGGRYGDEAFRRRAMECVWNLQAQQLDRCELAYRVANDCVNGEVALLPIFLNVTGNLQFNSAFRGFTRGPPLLQRLSLLQRLPLFQNLPLWLTTPAA